MEIFWIEDGQKQGPLPVVEIISKLEREELSENVKGWHIGCESWMPLKELPALSAYFDKKPVRRFPSPDDDSPARHAGTAPVATTMTFDDFAETLNKEGQAKVVMMPPLIIRFWARVTDILICWALYFLPVPLFNIEFHFWYLALGIFITIPYETFFISLFGTTPGKALMNIRILTTKEKKLSIGLSFMRAMYVFIMGQGFMQFPFMPLMSLLSWYLTRKTGGIAPWDLKLRIISIMTRPISFTRIFACAWVIIIALLVIGNSMHPWEEDLRKELGPMWPENIEK